MEILKLWHIMVRWKKVFITVFLIIVLVPVAGSFLIKPVYKSRAKVWIKYKALVPQFVSSTLPSEFGKFSYANSDNVPDTFVTLIESRPVIDAVIKGLDLRDSRGRLFDYSAYVEPGYIKKVLTQKECIEAAQIEDSELFEIKAYSTDLDRAVNVANSTSDKFLELFNSINSEDIKRSRITLETQTERVRRDWNDAERKRMQFRFEHLTVDLDKQKSNILDKVKSQEDQIAANEAAIAADRAILASLEESLKKEADHTLTGDPVKNLATLSSYKNKLYDLELSLAEKLTQFKEVHPTIQSLQAEIEMTKKNIKTSLERSFSQEAIVQTGYFDTLVQKYGDALIEITTLSSKNTALKKNQQVLEIGQRNIIATEHEYAKLTQTSDNLKSVLNGLLQQLELVKIASAVNTENATIVERAVAPNKANATNYKYFPNRKLVVFFALFFGLITAFGVVLFLEYIDDTFRTRNDIEKSTKLSVLISIPEYKLQR